MNAGRFIFGIGGESLASAQNAYAVAWFFGKQLNFVFGLQLSFARVVCIRKIFFFCKKINSDFFSREV